VNPPLRTADDIAAIKAGLADGTIDAIATDHAPHAPHTKEAPLDQAPPGMLGLETALALASPNSPCRWPRWSPRSAGSRPPSPGSPTATVAPSRPANGQLVVFDPNHEWTVVPARLASKSRNTPYAGRTLKGKVRHTVFEGTPVVVDSAATR